MDEADRSLKLSDCRVDDSEPTAAAAERGTLTADSGAAIRRANGENGGHEGSSSSSSGDGSDADQDASGDEGDKIDRAGAACGEDGPPSRHAAYRAVPNSLWRADEDGSPEVFDFDGAFSFVHARFLELRRYDQRLAGQLVALRRAIAQAAKAHRGSAQKWEWEVGGGGRTPRRAASGGTPRTMDDQ